MGQVIVEGSRNRTRVFEGCLGILKTCPQNFKRFRAQGAIFGKRAIEKPQALVPLRRRRPLDTRTLRTEDLIEQREI
jgi:hypothetical protein